MSLQQIPTVYLVPPGCSEASGVSPAPQMACFSGSLGGHLADCCKRWDFVRPIIPMTFWHTFKFSHYSLQYKNIQFSKLRSLLFKCLTRSSFPSCRWSLNSIQQSNVFVGETCHKVPTGMMYHASATSRGFLVSGVQSKFFC